MDYPDGSRVLMNYGIEDGMFVTMVTDQENKKKKTLKDARGSIIFMKEYLNNSWVTTTYNMSLLLDLIFFVQVF